MESRALSTSRVAIVATVGALLLSVFAASTAQAGTIWVTDGGGSCSAFSFYGNTGSFMAPSSCPMSIQANAVIGLDSNAYWMTTAPSGITINSAWTANGDVTAGGWTPGVAIGDFWRDANTGVWGGSTLSQGQEWFNTGLEGSTNINSQIYGIQIVCTENNSGLGGCGWSSPPWFSVSGIELAGTEDSPPYVTGQGALWSTGSAVWNPPGDPWPVTLYASDVSGICSSDATVANGVVNGPSEPRNTTVWQQCPDPVSWSFNVDTRSQVLTDGSLTIDLNGTNAAGNEYVAQKVVSVDNDPVSVSLRSPNDPTPTVWVNHAVNIDATAAAGPSHVGGMNCSTDGTSAQAYPANGLTVNGDGVHTVSCTAWNNAVDPQGQPNTGTNTMSVHIDETPPAITFAPQNPGDPTGVVVNATDSESGVASGAIQMAPAGSQDWTSLASGFDGPHLLAHLDDAGLHGPYTVQATACDNVGNCATNSETLRMPLRLSAAADVGFDTISAPAKVVSERVHVDFHIKRERRDGRLIKVKMGGHYRMIRIVIGANTRCAEKLIKTGPQRWREITACRPLGLHVVTTKQVPYGKPFTLHGLLVTGDGVPISNGPVSILTAPVNGLNRFTPAATATTTSTGGWRATLPAGPSRIIRAVYAGSATLLPAAGQATVTVPARITLTASPHEVGWDGVVILRGHLEGGDVPPDGVALRLLIRLPHRSSPYEPVPFRTNARGDFVVRWTWGTGFGVVTYPFAVATTATESDYPFAASRSRWIPITFGLASPDRSSPPAHRHRRARSGT